MGTAHELWRQAALNNTPQFYGFIDPLAHIEGRYFIRKLIELSNDTNEDIISHCAYTYLSFNNNDLTQQVRMRQLIENTYIQFECDCGISKLASAYVWMVHLNNVHKWDWLTFANKFPEFENE